MASTPGVCRHGAPRAIYHKTASVFFKLASEFALAVGERILCLSVCLSVCLSGVHKSTSLVGKSLDNFGQHQTMSPVLVSTRTELRSRDEACMASDYTDGSAIVFMSPKGRGSAAGLLDRLGVAQEIVLLAAALCVNPKAFNPQPLGP